jgi:hypothetical protein
VSKVQEIQTALSQLSAAELEMVERKIVELKTQQANDEPYGYAIREYGVSPEELERFDKRMQSKIAEHEEAGKMRPFSGDIERDMAD